MNPREIVVNATMSMLFASISIHSNWFFVLFFTLFFFTDVYINGINKWIFDFVEKLNKKHECTKSKLFWISLHNGAETKRMFPYVNINTTRMHLTRSADSWSIHYIFCCCFAFDSYFTQIYKIINELFTNTFSPFISIYHISYTLQNTDYILISF